MLTRRELFTIGEMACRVADRNQDMDHDRVDKVSVLMWSSMYINQRSLVEQIKNLRGAK